MTRKPFGSSFGPVESPMWQMSLSTGLIELVYALDQGVYRYRFG